MKKMTITDFKNTLSACIDELGDGEAIVLTRRGIPVAKVMPISLSRDKTPSWKKPGLHLQLRGSDLSSAILDERR